MGQFLTWIGCPVGSFQFSTIVRLLCAVVCGVAVGLERGMKGRPAGVKTFSLVCIGATLAMITNEYIARQVGSGDLARMAAQVISGIGFLGAGTIMVTGANQVKGLTTAAALWVNAAIGITIGAGFYYGAIVTTILVVTCSWIFKSIDKLVLGNSRYMRLCVEAKNEECIVGLHKYFDEKNIHVKHMQRRYENNWYKDDTFIILELEFNQRTKHHQILEQMKDMEGVRFAEEI